ncbi:MAG: arginyltransferase [Pseudomonadota bacterium]
MSHFDKTLRSQFFLTGPRACPYLPERRERKLFTHLHGPYASALHDELAMHGFRRSQNIAYRPACAGCNACISTRVVAQEFAPTRSQKRVIRRNSDLVRSIDTSWATEEQFALFSRYLEARHADGGMTDMDLFDFAAMVEDTPVRTRVVEYRLPASETGGDEPGALVAVCVTDMLDQGVSLVYSFFDPRQEKRSLGQYIILDHIQLAVSTNVPYVYLGYWVPGSRKMDYKIRFSPAEILTERGWRRFDPAIDLPADEQEGAPP